MEKNEYLNEIIEELVNEEEWELPKEQRFWLTTDLDWNLLIQ